MCRHESSPYLFSQVLFICIAMSSNSGKYSCINSLIIFSLHSSNILLLFLLISEFSKNFIFFCFNFPIFPCALLSENYIMEPFLFSKSSIYIVYCSVFSWQYYFLLFTFLRILIIRFLQGFSPATCTILYFLFPFSLFHFYFLVVC